MKQKRAPARYWTQQECTLFLEGIKLFGTKGMSSYFRLIKFRICLIFVTKI